jgi:phosphonatase-like hydrolase
LLAGRLRAAPGLAFPAAAPAFARLRAAGARLALNTGFDRSVVDLILAETAWPEGLVDVVVCGDDVAAGRPAPDMIRLAMARVGVTDPRRVAVVGDTRLDLEAGANAGVAWRIGVLTGAHDRATLERAPATHIIPSIEDLPGLWG